MSPEDLREAQKDYAGSGVNLDRLAHVLREVLAAAPGDGLALVVQNQIARSAASDEPKSAEEPETALACDILEARPPE